MARLTLKETADKLGLSTRTLRRRIKEGSIYAALDEGQYFIDSNEVDRVRGKDIKRKPGKAKMSTITETITLDRKEYDIILTKLAVLEAENKNYQKLLGDQRPWWKRVFR